MQLALGSERRSCPQVTCVVAIPLRGAGEETEMGAPLRRASPCVGCTSALRARSSSSFGAKTAWRQNQMPRAGHVYTLSSSCGEQVLQLLAVPHQQSGVADHTGGLRRAKCPLEKARPEWCAPFANGTRPVVAVQTATSAAAFVRRAILPFKSTRTHTIPPLVGSPTPPAVSRTPP